MLNIFLPIFILILKQLFLKVKTKFISTGGEIQTIDEEIVCVSACLYKTFCVCVCVCVCVREREWENRDQSGLLIERVECRNVR